MLFCFSVIEYKHIISQYASNELYYILDVRTSNLLEGNEMEEMTRWELLTLLLSIKGLLETDNTEKALEVINSVIAEAKKNNN